MSGQTAHVPSQMSQPLNPSPGQGKQCLIVKKWKVRSYDDEMTDDEIMEYIEKEDEATEPDEQSSQKSGQSKYKVKKSKTEEATSEEQKRIKNGTNVKGNKEGNASDVPQDNTAMEIKAENDCKNNPGVTSVK